MSGKCPIQDVAEDLEVNAVIDQFLKIKSLDASAGYSKIQQQMLEESGLADEPELLVRFEQIILNVQHDKREEHKAKENSKKRTPKAHGIRHR